MKARDYLIIAVMALLVWGHNQKTVEPTPATPIDRVVVIYESLNQPVAQVSVMGGTTSQALRKASKWGQYDKDKIPEEAKAALVPVVAKDGIPCVVLFRGGSVSTSAALPATDQDLAAYLQKNGGF